MRINYQSLLQFSDRTRMIRELALSRPGARGVEVGVWNGDFSATLLPHPNLERLYLVDRWLHSDGPDKGDTANYFEQAQHDEAHKMTETRFAADISTGRVKIIHMDSISGANHIADAELDFAYVDADHLFENALADLKAYAPKVKPDGFLMGHDFCVAERTMRGYYAVFEAVLTFLEEEPAWKLVAVTVEGVPSFALRRQ